MNIGHMPAASISPQPQVPYLERYFDISLYLMVFMGFVALVSTGTLDFPTQFIIFSALAFRGYLLAHSRNLLIPESWTNSLTLAYVAFYLADYLLLSGGFLSATVHLVLFVMGVRLFSIRRDRDRYFLAIIAFLMVLAASVLTVDSVFLAAFSGFMLVAVATFILMEMRHAQAQAAALPQDSSSIRPGAQMMLSVAAASPVLVALILLGAAAIFFILPRVSAGYLSAYSPGNQLATGFSDRVQLGQIGEIQQSDSVVMHIAIEGDTRGGFDLKWRGVALNVFDGQTWMNPHQQHRVPHLPDGTFALALSPGLRNGSLAGHLIHYRVLMEPVSTNVFFLAAIPQTLEGNYREVSMDGGGAVFDLDPAHPLAAYTATSNIARPSVADLRRASVSYPPQILLDYLQLPHLDPRIPRLATQITSAAGNNYDRAAAIESYLRTHFGYTLQLSRVRPRDPLAEFLFERKRGHCEYFASAMAIMLRTLGIPSRVVNGFRTGEFNDLTSQYVIRDRDAHSWVEAYFPGYGWVSFDPTPAAAATGYGAWNRMALYLDAMASFWREWVVNYDVQHQQQLGQEADYAGRTWVHRARHWARTHYNHWLASARSLQRRWAHSPVAWTAFLLGLTGLLGILVNFRRLGRMLQRRRLARHPASSPRQAATIWYERMMRSVMRRGWRRPPALTPREFVASIDDELVKNQVARFTSHYENARFGGSAEDASRLPELCEEIEASARR
jgi:protein-glutamine gamma-glutamyltransferase